MPILWLSVPTLAAAQQAPNGEAVYQQHCAGCHEGTMARTGQGGPEMVLDIDNPPDDGGFLDHWVRIRWQCAVCREQLCSKSAEHGRCFVGFSRDRIVGRWIDEQLEDLFSFALPNEEDEQQ